MATLFFVRSAYLVSELACGEGRAMPVHATRVLGVSILAAWVKLVVVRCRLADS